MKPKAKSKIPAKQKPKDPPKAKKATILSTLALLLTITASASAALPNPVAHWAFDEGTGNIAYDSVGTNDGALIGDPTWTTGQIDGALDFDGSSSHVIVPDSDSISVGNQSYTISAWIYPDSITSAKTIVSKVKDGADKEYLFRILDGELTLDMETNSNNQDATTTTTPVTVGSWQHVVVTFNSSTMTPTFYYNGQPQTSTNEIDTLPDQSNDDLYIGMLGGTYQSALFDGKIDDVRIYDKALSAGEVETIFEEAVSPIELSSSEFEFDAKQGDVNPADQILSIRNLGPNTLDWAISEDCNWLEVDPNTGSSTGEVDDVNLSVDITGLSVGDYNCVVTVSDSNATIFPRVVNVLLDITEITPSPFWKDQIVFPGDPFSSEGVFENDPGWVKFTMLLLEPYDPNIVYFQDSQEYIFHYDFATEWIDPFIDMSVPEFFDVTLYQSGQLGVLGAIILPPMAGNPPSPEFDEYGIQFVRYDPYSKEEIAAMFDVVKSSVTADAGVTAYYFPTYEQAASAEADRAWLLSQGIPVGSVAQWFQGNICYSEGWAIGELKYFTGDQIKTAYQSGQLEPNDILLTDGIPAEIPMVAGVMTLSPTTSNSHVAILARTYGVPFVYLGLGSDINEANDMVGLDIVMCVENNAGNCTVTLRDADEFSDSEIEKLLDMKEPETLSITPTSPLGSYSGNTNELSPSDIGYFGGKASNYGILRDAIESNCPNAMAISFDLWNEFLDQPLVLSDSVVIEPNSYLIFWADNDEDQGTTHTGFKLSADGEYVGLYDTDGTTLIDGLTFGAQSSDVSYGRSPDGNNSWVLFSGGTATPGTSNTGGGGPTSGLFINEFMADNDSTIQDPCGDGYPDWIELYNAGSTAIDLGSMYLTDDASDPTKWMIPAGISGSTLREEITNRLAGYSYPPTDMAGLSADLSAIRSLFKSSVSTNFTQLQKDAIIAVLQDPNYGFDVNSKIRFRSSTNVEDSDAFVGAGLYDSYSGCLADELDADDDGPCICDANESSERGVFRAIRKVFASFYNDNAFIERLRYDVDEAEVGMALLVHHSFPDEFELANGVATLEKNSSSPDKIVKLVTQKGAVSVANPDDSSIPEEVEIYIDGAGVKTATLVQGSSLVILGDKVMDWLADYNDLTELLLDVSVEFENITGKNDYILDFEYKKLSPNGAAMPAGGLVVKQVREIPRVAAEQLACPEPVLPTDCSNPCTYEGGYLNIDGFTSSDGVSIATSYYLYCPPGWICKIDEFSHWVVTVISGLTTEPIILYSCSSQCYTAGWHNWCKTFLFEPMFEPGISQSIVDQLWLMNIKGIGLYGINYCGDPGIRYYDFDDQVFYGKPIPGDYDHDGDVDFVDLMTITQRWLDEDCGTCGRADLSYDNKVDFRDFAIFAEHWLEVTSQ
ncbi:MAG: hypothetical protein KAS75_00035 [Planctomycetes bacterium]|nr:hypothetical protein [Planctomycetota bacterium]